MENHEEVTQKDETRLTEDRRNEITVPDKYKDHKVAFLQLLTEFENMWEGHLGRIKTARHQIELADSDIRPVYSAPYRVGQK